MTSGVTASVQELITLRRHAHKGLFPSHKLGDVTGQYMSARRGRGMEFAEVRNYQAGDEIRHMEWRVTARTGRPHVKIYHEERERPVILLVDFNPSMYFGTRCAFKSVVAARLASLFAWQALQQGDKIGGLLFSAKTHHEYMPHARETSLMRLLARLAYYTETRQPARPRPLSDAFIRLKRVNKPGSLIIVISDFYTFNADCAQHLSQLRQHNDVLFYHIVDPLEQQAPPPGIYPMSNGQDTFLLDTTDPSTQALYNTYWTERTHKLKQHCRKHGLSYTRISTEQDLTQSLYQEQTHGA